MASEKEFAARGKVLSSTGDSVKFNPSGTNYEMDLKVTGGYQGKIGVPVDGVIRVTARKVWTVPSGGNFVAPIFGPPKTIQGRVKSATETQLVVQAGFPIVVEMDAATAVELPEGGIQIGGMVNVVGMSGGSVEF